MGTGAAGGAGRNRRVVTIREAVAVAVPDIVPQTGVAILSCGVGKGGLSKSKAETGEKGRLAQGTVSTR